MILIRTDRSVSGSRSFCNIIIEFYIMMQPKFVTYRLKNRSTHSTSIIAISTLHQMLIKRLSTANRLRVSIHTLNGLSTVVTKRSISPSSPGPRVNRCYGPLKCYLYT